MPSLLSFGSKFSTARSVLLTCLATTAVASAEVIVDGRLGSDPYGPAVAVQQAATGFGDNTNPDPLGADGSELNAAYAVIRDGHLYLLLTGNLETNFNKLEIFIDSVDGGQQVLASDNPDIDFNGLNAMAGLGFDSGFMADHYFTIGGGFEPVQFFLNHAVLGNPGVATYLGDTGSPNPEFPVVLAGGVLVGIDNSNVGGVSSTTADGALGATSGVEMAIPLALIGNPTGAVRICAFINNSGHTFLSNQILGSLPADYGNLGPPNTVNFGDELLFPGEQFFTAPWQVTNANDTGAGSLRAILTGLSHGGRIVFDPALSGATITLTGGELAVEVAVELDAGNLGAGLILSGANTNRIARVAAGAALTATGITFRDGYAEGLGGALLNLGQLLLVECSIEHSFATALGGGLANDDGGVAALERCTLSGNRSADDGGAIANRILGAGTTLTLWQCTLAGNEAFDQGGGIWNTGTLTLVSSTVSGNSAGGLGAGVRSLGAVPVVAVVNSIVAGNDGAQQFSGTIHSEQGVNLLAGDPQLAPLANYGGRVATRPPLPASPVVDVAGESDPEGTDQRGFPRVVNGVLDIGAVEYQGLPDLIGFGATDWDRDGWNFDLEYALGSDPQADDPERAQLFRLTRNASGEPEITFALSPAARDTYHWVLQRTTDLSGASWSTVYRFYGPTQTEFLADGIQSMLGGTGVTVTDPTAPGDHAFYRLQATIDLF